MKIISIIGARPQFVKAAVFRKYCRENGVNEILLHTGQHYDHKMSDGIFKELRIKSADIKMHLDKRTHGGMTGELIGKIESVLLHEKPDFVNLYGDTNSTLSGALAAAKLNIPVIHIEAGLRSFNKVLPEEVNRVLTDHVSTYLFCPTATAVENLKNENITKNVFHVGDITLDAVSNFRSEFKLPRNINLSSNKPLAIMTVHREATVVSKTRLTEIIDYCKEFSNVHQIIFPIHPNTRQKIIDHSIDVQGITLIDPVSYLEMQGLLTHAELVLTDSGGLQKEAYFHGCSCITLRDETEWVETISAGWNRLWKAPSTEITPKVHINEYGEGKTCQKIFEALNFK
ncbi:UDP-N-acetylglucosamine 2-epimerase (non-hydrolyzing) [Paracoccaceae bacterium]|nr:UDP-N-acetylglucosamine 2-epimerase (non-hydrolyzing) [Paracoccaceae bacterium]